jgi:acetyltransferase-like isoleucine patch superfamily enzyme
LKIVASSLDIFKLLRWCNSVGQLGERRLIDADCRIVNHDFISFEAVARRSATTAPFLAMPGLIEQETFLSTHCIVLKGGRIRRAAAILVRGGVAAKEVSPRKIARGNPSQLRHA